MSLDQFDDGFGLNDEVGQDDQYIGPGSTIGPLPSTINAAYRQAVRAFKQGCTEAGGYWVGSGENLQCLGGQEAYDAAIGVGENAPAYNRAQEWINTYGSEFSEDTPEESSELTEWQTNKDYIVSQCTDGTCPNSDMQAWYDRWVFSGSPDTKDGMVSVEDYEAATQPQEPVVEQPVIEEPQDPTIEDLANEYGQDLVDRAQDLYDVFSSKIEGAIDDPLGTIKNILDTVLPQLPPECREGPKPNDWWKDCTNLRVITSLPGIDLDLPGIFDIEATVRDIENAIIEAGKTLDDFINDPKGTINSVIKDIKTSVEDAWAGIDDKTSGGLLDWLIDNVGVVVGGFILGSIEDHVKEAIDPFALIENCLSSEYAQSEQGKIECDQYVEQGQLDLCEDGSYAKECSQEEEEEVISDITVDTTQDMVGDPCDSNGDGTLDGTLQAVGGLTLGGGSNDGSQLECVPKATGEEVEEVQEEVEEVQQEVQLCDDPNRQTNTDGSCAENCKFGFEPNEEGVCVETQFDEGVEVNECTNGATNYPDCNQCPPGYVFGGLTFGGGSGECVRDTTVIEDPECNDCTCNDYAAANPLECGWVECPDGGFAPTVEQCAGGGTGCPEGQVPCATLGGACTTPEACPGEEEEESGGGGGGGGGGSAGLFKPFTPTLSGDPELLARQEFPITDFLMGLFTGK